MTVQWVVCRPRFDQATIYSYDWAQQIIEWLQTKGIDYVDLRVEEAVREKVEEALKNNPSAGWVHYNHGNEDKVWGNDDRPVVDLENYNLLKDRECYNMNCLSAKVLGKGAYTHYNAVYWGYVETFSFTTDALEEFKEAANHGFKLRIDGEADWKEILKETKRRMTEIIDDLVKTGRILGASLLRGDRDALVCYNGETPPDGDGTPPPVCPVSRFIMKFLGYDVLKRLRLVRNFWTEEI